MFSRFSIQTRMPAIPSLFFPIFGTLVMTLGYYPERRKALRLLTDTLVSPAPPPRW